MKPINILGIETNDEYVPSEEESNIVALNQTMEFFEKISDEISEKNSNFPNVLKDITNKLEALPNKLNISQRTKGDESGKQDYAKRIVPPGPWELGASNLKSEINDILNTTESFEKLNNELNDQVNSFKFLISFYFNIFF